MKKKMVISPNTREMIARSNRGGGKLPKKVAIIYTEDRREYFKTEEEYYTVAGSQEEAEAFGPVLKSLGVKYCAIVGDHNMAKALEKEKPDMAINLVTTVKGYDYLGATVPATLELLEIPYTGADILGISLGCNKYLIHALLSQHGIRVPNFQLMTDNDTPLSADLRFPLILKLNEEHSGVEIKRESVVEDEKQLRKRLKYLLRKYDQDVLVSEFIDGREFGAFIFKSMNKKVYIIERRITMPKNETKHQFMDYEMTWYLDQNPKYLKHEKYRDPELDKIVKKAYDIVRMSDYGKFDVRMDTRGNYYIIDANANNHFGPPAYDCEMVKVMGRYGISFKTLVRRLLVNTMREWGY